MIYLINAEGTDLYKIGFTNQNPNNRMKVLQTGCPYKLKLIDVFNGGLAIEKEIHNTYKKVRKQGEWFEFKNIEAVVSFIKEKTSDKNYLNNHHLIEWKQYLINSISGKDINYGKERGITNLLELAIINIKLKEYQESIKNICEYLAVMNGRYSNNDHIKNVYIPSSTKKNKVSQSVFVKQDEMIWKNK